MSTSAYADPNDPNDSDDPNGPWFAQFASQFEDDGGRGGVQFG